jgi:hypothetical protein
MSTRDCRVFVEDNGRVMIEPALGQDIEVRVSDDDEGVELVFEDHIVVPVSVIAEAVALLKGER